MSLRSGNEFNEELEWVNPFDAVTSCMRSTTSLHSPN